jgi:NAD(P)-dependent dehydrogenase (short-subunit alcohol dehydrogenase family)
MRGADPRSGSWNRPQLGAAGATVYVTGRTSLSKRSEMNRPETIEETAALIDEASVAESECTWIISCPDEVRALVARIQREQRALHILVNDISGQRWNKSVWESEFD